MSPSLAHPATMPEQEARPWRLHAQRLFAENPGARTAHQVTTELLVPTQLGVHGAIPASQLTGREDLECP